MKTKMVFLLALILALIMASTLPTAAIAAGTVVPFKATYVTHPTQVFDPTTGLLIVSIPSEGLATHLGESTFYADMWVDPSSYPFNQGGDMSFTAADGSTLSGSFAGYAIPTATGVEFWGEYWFTGGAGRFEKVDGGTGSYWGAVVGETGELHFDGTLVK